MPPFWEIYSSGSDVFVLVYPGFFPRPEVPCPVPPRAAFLLCSLSLASVEMLRASSEAIASDRAPRSPSYGIDGSGDGKHETQTHRHEAVLPQSMLPCLWSSLPLELRFHDHLDIGLVGTVDLLFSSLSPILSTSHLLFSPRNQCDLCEVRPHHKCLAWHSVP
jgi:hypothetical protein